MNKIIDKIKNLGRRKTVFWIPAIAIMIVIFVFSSRNADDSTGDSHRIGIFIGYITQYDFDRWTEDAQIRYAEKLDHPIRKTAHFLEYMTLAECLTAAWYDSKKKRISNMGVPVAIGVVYAALDEVHQLFVSGRAGMFSDVLLDSCGVITGMLIVSLIIGLFRKYMED